MTAVVLFLLKTMAQRRLRHLLAFTAVAGAATLAMAVMVMVDSLDGSIERIEDTLAGASDLQVVALSDVGMDTELVEQVRGIEGVRSALPLVRSFVSAEGESVLLIGSDAVAFAAGADAGAAGADGGDLGGVVVGEALAHAQDVRPGDAIEVYARGTAREVQVQATVPGGALAALNQGRVIAAPLGLAQELTGRPDRVDQILVTAEPGAAGQGARPGDGHVDAAELAASIEQEITGAAVKTTDEQVADATAGLAPVWDPLSLLAVVVLFISLFLVYNTASLSALEHRRELATCRALGARRRAVLAGLAAQAAVLGLLAAGVGVLAGQAVSRMLIGGLPRSMMSSLGAELTTVVTPRAVTLTVSVVIAASVLAALLPAWRAAQVPPVVALRPADLQEADPRPPRGRWWVTVLGLGLLVGGIATVIRWRSAHVDAAAGLLISGWVLATAGLVAWLTAVTVGVARLFRGPGALGATALARAPRRTWATVVAVGTAVAIAVGMGSVAENTADASERSFRAAAGIDLLVQGVPADDIPTQTVLPDTLGRQLSGVPGVERVLPTHFGYVQLKGSRVLMQGIAAGSEAPTRVNASAPARERFDAQEGVIITRSLEIHHKVRDGDTLWVDTPTGQHEAEVLDVVPSVLWPNGMIILPAAWAEEWFDRAGASTWELYLEPGADPESVRQAVQDLVEDFPVPVFVFTGEEAVTAGKQAVGQGVNLLAGLQLLVLVIGAITILNTLFVSVLLRRRELAVLRAIGTTRRFVTLAVVSESLALATVAVVLGLPLGLAFQRLAMIAGGVSQGLDMGFALAPGPIAVAVAGAVATAVLGGLLASRRATRAAIVTGLTYE